MRSFIAILSAFSISFKRASRLTTNTRGLPPLRASQPAAWPRAWGALLTAALLAGCAGQGAPKQTADEAACRGRKMGELPMVPVSAGGYYVVPVYFGSHPRSMIVDTGATSNVLFRATLPEEGLYETGKYQFSALSAGVGGVARGGIATVPLLKFAGIALPDVTM